MRVYGEVTRGGRTALRLRGRLCAGFDFALSSIDRYVLDTAGARVSVRLRSVRYAFVLAVDGWGGSDLKTAAEVAGEAGGGVAAAEVVAAAPFWRGFFRAGDCCDRFCDGGSYSPSPSTSSIGAMDLLIRRTAAAASLLGAMQMLVPSNQK
jgi:hypothetical protein